MYHHPLRTKNAEVFHVMNKFIFLLILVISNKNTGVENTLYSAVFKPKPGEDTYSVDTYRYEPSIGACFGAVGEKFGENIVYFNKDGVSSLVGWFKGYTAAQKFTAETLFCILSMLLVQTGAQPIVA